MNELTRLDYFAAHIMAALLNNQAQVVEIKDIHRLNKMSGDYYSIAAHFAYKAAEALEAERQEAEDGRRADAKQRLKAIAEAQDGLEAVIVLADRRGEGYSDAVVAAIADGRVPHVGMRF